jgi:hypothetical protein
MVPSRLLSRHDIACRPAAEPFHEITFSRIYLEKEKTGQAKTDGALILNEVNG